jgi:hypothetical protein
MKRLPVIFPSMCPRSTRAASRAAWSLVLVAILGLCSAGCDKVRSFLFDVPTDEPPIPPLPTGSASAGEGSARRPFDVPDAGVPKVPLDPKVRRALKLPPRRASTSQLAFGKGRLGVLGKSALMALDTKTFTSTLTFPLEHPRGVLSLADGSLVAIGSVNTFRLSPQDPKPKLLPRVTLLPDSSLLADRVNPDRFWALPRSGGALFGFDAVSSYSALLLASTQWVELDGFDRRAIGLLRDGSFLYTSGTSFRQFYGSGKRQPVDGPSRDVWRILPGARPDNAWVFAGKTATLYIIIAGKLEKQRTVELETTPFDAESSGSYLAVLELAQPGEAPWGFVLEVFDGAGKRRLRAPLDAVESFDEDWAEKLTENRSVAVFADPPLVAVGGDTHVDVWAADKGSTLFSGDPTRNAPIPAKPPEK